jgi:outer membrane immunogenic protein
MTTTSLALGNTPADLTGSAVSQPFDGTGFRATPFVGFNWQFAPRWVMGIEGDNGFGKQTSRLGGFPGSPGASQFLFTAEEQADGLAVKTTWDASVRARLGFLLAPAIMSYVTGGAAWQRYEVTSTCASNDCSRALNLKPAVVANSSTDAGWTVGGGIEVALRNHWLARAEYRYADFGVSAHMINRKLDASPVIDRFDVQLRTHAATFSVAYKFGDPIASNSFGDDAGARNVADSWSGVYAGFGAGPRAARTDVKTTSASTDGLPIELGRFATSLPFDGVTFRASPYFGVSWEIASRLVAGLEGDFAFGNQTTKRLGFDLAPAILISGVQEDSLAVKATWDASLRGRFGFLLTPATMAYATGGAAWQHVEIISTCANVTCVSDPSHEVIANSFTRPGWTLGAGIETAVSTHWLARAQYRYADFGTVPFTIARRAVGLSNVDTMDVRLRTHTVMFGLGYKFN